MARSRFKQFILDVFTRESDPVKHCELFLNADGKGSCPHVDGLLCDYPCDMLRKYRERRGKE